MSLFNSDFGSKRIREIIKRENVKIFFSGVLGAGMLPLAELMSSRGALIFGNDRTRYLGGYAFLNKTEPLREVGTVDLLVYSLAISEDDADIREAKEKNIPLVSRAELLGAVMLDYPIRIGVAGSHGKSTTVAMLDTLFRASGLRGVTLSGAELNSGSALVCDGDGFFLFEACEYKNSFLKMHPTCAVVTNAELDHTDFFRDEDDISASFIKWINSGEEYAVIGEDSPLSERIITAGQGSVYTVGKTDKSDFVYKIRSFFDTGYSFELYFREKLLGTFSISALGEHNVANASLALAVLYLHGVSPLVCSDALQEFRGIKRRGELLGTIGGRAVYYDYAHHPTEIAATVGAIKKKEKKVTVIFRPHMYTRTKSLWNEFRASLRTADFSVILDIYPAREPPIDGVTADNLAVAVGNGCVYQKMSDVVNYCLQNTSGAIVLMGAGDVDLVKNELISMMD